MRSEGFCYVSLSLFFQISVQILPLKLLFTAYSNTLIGIEVDRHHHAA